MGGSIIFHHVQAKSELKILDEILARWGVPVHTHIHNSDFISHTLLGCMRLKMLCRPLSYKLYINPEMLCIYIFKTYLYAVLHLNVTKFSWNFMSYCSVPLYEEKCSHKNKSKHKLDKHLLIISHVKYIILKIV